MNRATNDFKFGIRFFIIIQYICAIPVLDIFSPHLMVAFLNFS